MSPISCQLHDYIEIACLYQLEISIALIDGRNMQGSAMTTETTPEREELLILKTTSGPQKINLSDIKSMTALTDNPHFSQIEF